MRLFEFQAKRIFRDHGIPTLRSVLLTSAEEASSLEAPMVLKAQVLAGGRGKAGGVKIWDGSQDAGALVRELLSMEIKGEKVRAVLAEEKATILHEYYMSITVNGTAATPVLVASEAGGVDIERVAQETPEKIVTIPINPLIGPSDYQVRALAKGIGVKDRKGLKKIVDGLWSVFSGCDATLVEVNPLVSTPDGFVALDGKMVIDDKAAFRQGEALADLKAEQGGFPEPRLSRAFRHDYLRALDGTVGLISDGPVPACLPSTSSEMRAGLQDFCEMGGLTSPQVMYDAMSAVLSDDKVKKLLVVLIGGFNRMDEMAEGIIRYRDERGLNVPIVVRCAGPWKRKALR